MKLFQNTAVRQIASSIIYYSGFLALWQRAANRRRPLIVYYHEIFDTNDNVEWCHEKSLLLPVSLFRAQLSYLNKHYDVVSLDEAFLSGSPNVAAITFDDGYRGVYRRAFPILKEMGFTATIFLITDYVGLAELPWWENLIIQLQAFFSLPYEKRSSVINQLSSKWSTLLNNNLTIESAVSLFEMATTDERTELKEAFRGIFGNPRQCRERIFLSEEEIREMQNAGMNFGAHTKSHPILTWLDDETLLQELKGSKEGVERLTRISPCWFAYPDGIFSDREQKAVQDLGFRGAVQTFRNPHQLGQFAVSRIPLKRKASTGVHERFSRALMEVTLADFNVRRIAMAMNSLKRKL